MAFMGRKSALMAGIAALAFAGAALAATNVEVVKARQDSMKAQAADLKAVTDYSRGKGDKDAALKAADDLIEHASKDAKLFPKGTSSADLPGKSNAKPAIWTDQARFQAILAAMHDKAVKLPALIKTSSPADVHTAAMDLAKAGCVACHSDYRESGGQ
jgi:cytochrome c556